MNRSNPRSGAISRRTVLGLGLGGLAAGAASLFVPGLLRRPPVAPPFTRRTSWSGAPYQATGFVEPETVEAVKEHVLRGASLKPVGTGHTFNDISDFPNATQMSLGRMRKISIAADRQSVTFEAGWRYGELVEFLDRHGLTVVNMASLGHISAFGSFKTGTHGSGLRNKCLASSVIALKLILANGRELTLTREKDGDRFLAAVTDLGALGIVVEVTMKVVPAFRMMQNVYLDMTVPDFLDNFDGVMGAGYSVSAFTNYDGKVSEVWVKSEFTPGFRAPNVLHGARLQDKKVHPVMGLDPENCTPQNESAPSWEILPHFKMGFRPASGDEVHAEFFVERRNAPAAYRAIMSVRRALDPVFMVSEVRTIETSDIWLDPAYGRDSVAFHFSWKNDPQGVLRVLPVLERALAPFDARAHWGKMFTLTGEQLARLYPKLADFRALREELDPSGLFLNPYLRRVLNIAA